MRSTTRARLALCSAPLMDSVERASKEELLFAEVPDERSAALLAADPVRYREVVLREPFSRFSRPVVVDVSRLPARYTAPDLRVVVERLQAAVDRLESQAAENGAVMRTASALGGF